ncbi:MAG: DNA helicase [Pseudonocardiaceae bacterium]|nr:MAG: DNA helicase [Pseudonocardiaceae bacterium]
MAQLAVGVSFLSEYAKLEKKVQKATDKALGLFGEHTHAGLHLEKIANSTDPQVRTIRIDKFWRGVVAAPTKGDRYTLLHVLPHDDAIAWAQSHSLSVNEVTGVLEISDIDALQALAEQHQESEDTLLFAEVSDADLKRLGIDARVLAAARTLHDEPALDAVSALIPENQADVLRALAAGFTVEQVWADIVAPRIPDEPIDPDDIDAAVERTQGRIALVDGPEDLLALFAKPMAMWRVFLHPAQESVAYRPTYWGSAQITGGPGTGKTVVALHRVAHLVRSKDLPPRSILLTTFTRGLAEALDRDLAQLLEPTQRAAVDVLNVDRWALGVVREKHGNVKLAKDSELRARLQQPEFSPAFLLDEWREVVLANDATTEADYLAAPRRGRGRGLTKVQKRAVWSILSPFAEQLRKDGLWTFHTLANEAARLVAERDHPPFRHVVVDEIQDLHPCQWRLLRAAVAPGPDDLFLTGDPHQRIYGNHVSLKQVGINVAGRSTRLRINYRTSAEILRWSLGVMSDVAVADLDGGVDSLAGYRSALHGTAPEVEGYTTQTAEIEDLALAAEQWHDDGVAWQDIAVVARTNKLVDEVAAELGRHGVPTAALNDSSDAVRIGTMHGMKGLEFRCVAIAAAGAAQLPSTAAVTPADEDPVRHILDVQQERCLLFVAATRARELLRVSWSGSPSPLLPG